MVAAKQHRRQEHHLRPASAAGRTTIGWALRGKKAAVCCHRVLLVAIDNPCSRLLLSQQPLGFGYAFRQLREGAACQHERVFGGSSGARSFRLHTTRREARRCAASIEGGQLTGLPQRSPEERLEDLAREDDRQGHVSDKRLSLSSLNREFACLRSKDMSNLKSRVQALIRARRRYAEPGRIEIHIRGGVADGEPMIAGCHGAGQRKIFRRKPGEALDEVPRAGETGSRVHRRLLFGAAYRCRMNLRSMTEIKICRAIAASDLPSPS